MGEDISISISISIGHLTGISNWIGADIYRISYGYICASRAWVLFEGGTKLEEGDPNWLKESPNLSASLNKVGYAQTKRVMTKQGLLNG